MKVAAKLQLPDGTVIDSEDLNPEERLAYIEFALHLAVPTIAKFLVGESLEAPNTEHVEATKEYDKWYFDLPPTLTVKEAAKILRVGTSAVYEMCRVYHGEFFPHLKVGSRILIPRDKFIEWMNAGGTDYYKKQVKSADEDRAKQDSRKRGFKIKA